VSERLCREVRKDCTVAVHGNRYVVPHTLVGQQVIVRVRHGRLRVFDGALLMAEYEMPEGKFRSARRHKGRAILSPSKPAYPIEVERRSLADYARVGGAVSVAETLILDRLSANLERLRLPRSRAVLPEVLQTAPGKVPASTATRCATSGRVHSRVRETPSSAQCVGAEGRIALERAA
jgi:hypothetical protein